MKKNYLRLLLLAITFTLGASWASKAQQDFKISYWIDSSKQATFEQIQTKQFIPTKKQPNLGFVKYPVWVRLQIAPKNSDDKHILEMQARADTIIFWQKDKHGKWNAHETGDRLPFRTRSLAHYRILFPLYLPAQNTHEVYVCYKTHTQMKLYMQVWEERAFQAIANQANLLYGILYGVILLMIIYNIFIWLVVRDVAYLYYIGFAFFMLLIQAQSHLYQYVWGDYVTFNNNGVYYWVGALNICSANFARLFLNTRKYAPRLEKILLYLTGYGIFVMICTTFLSFSATSRIIFTFNPPYTLFLLIAGILVWRKGNPYAQYYVWAWSAYFVGIFILAIHNRNLIGNSFLTSYALEISTLIEIVMLSLAMSYKYKIISEESEQNKLKIQAAAYQQQLKEEENKYLQEKMLQEKEIHEEIIALKDRELATLTMQMFEKNTFINDIQRQLQRIAETETDTSQHLKNIGKNLQETLNLDEDWDKYRFHFEQVHPNFFQRLASEYPQLTTHDQKTLAYIRINLSTKDMARLLNIETKSVKMIKYRLKKKLNLLEEMDLENFIKAL